MVVMISYFYVVCIVLIKVMKMRSGMGDRKLSSEYKNPLNKSRLKGVLIMLLHQ